MRATKGSGQELILATSLNYWRYAALGSPGSGIRPLPASWTALRVMAGDEFVVSGWWGSLGPRRAAVFVRDGGIRVAFEREEWPLDEALTCQLRQSRKQTRFRLLREGEIVASCEYPTPRRPRSHWLDWPLDPEDWDFGRFIGRMIERRLEEPRLETVWPFTRRLRGPEPDA